MPNRVPSRGASCNFKPGAVNQHIQPFECDSAVVVGYNQTVSSSSSSISSTSSLSTQTSTTLSSTSQVASATPTTACPGDDSVFSANDGRLYQVYCNLEYNGNGGTPPLSATNVDTLKDCADYCAFINGCTAGKYCTLTIGLLSYYVLAAFPCTAQTSNNLLQT